jgi:tetratricopeptide (TPR) repeat protein
MPRPSRINPDRAVLIGLLVTAAVYCRDLRYDFILDDVPLILMNETIGSWHNWKTPFLNHIFFSPGPRVPLTFTAVHYRPAYMLWLMANQSLFGALVPWWHLTSLLLHLVVVFLVYRLGAKMLKEPWAGALAALLFAFHPIHVESVGYVSASTDLLVTLFLLISFLSYSRFREQGPSLGYWIASIFAAALAMLSKESAVMYPWILVAYEALREAPPEARPGWRRFVWTLPFFGIVASYLLIRTWLFGPNLGPGPGGSRLAAVADAPLVLIVYLRNLLWSFRLSFYYPIEWSSQWTLVKGFVVVCVVGMVAFLWSRYRDRTTVRLQLVWTGILFATPVMAVSTFVREDWVHDRHMYLVSVPFCLLAAALLTDARLPRIASVIASSLVLAALLAETAIQLPRFTDAMAVYESTLQLAPDNVLAHRFYAFSLWGHGRHEEAFREFRIATELSPKDPVLHGTYADALAEIGRDDDATTEYAKALRWASGGTEYRAFLLSALAAIEVKHSKPEEAAGHLREALQIAPQVREYSVLLAQALRQQGLDRETNDATRQQRGSGPSLIPTRAGGQ